MGYYTTFELHLLEDPLQQKRTFFEALSKNSGYDICSYFEAKWYNHYGDCIDTTKQFPEILLLVEGTGEDGYCYKDYFQNGRGCHIEPIWPEFDKNMLE